jgi:uncharacterized protein (TIGR02271 family)
MAYRTLGESDGQAVEFPDVRGWTVRDVDGRRVGQVHEILLGVDRTARFVDVRAGGLLDPGRVVVPVGLLTLNASRQTVQVRGMKNEAIRALPDYGGDPRTVDDAFEHRLRLGIPGPLRAELFSTRSLYEAPAAPAAEPLGPDEEEVRIPVTEEELFITTRPVVREELVIRKRVIEETRTVEGEVRREVVEVRETGRTR